MNILDDLNEKQKEAVTHKEGPLLVIAGPGTGKTKVITHRIAYLIDKHKVTPEKILAITFTNKASQEMRERVNNEIGEPPGSNVKISTFHAFCNRTLRKYASEAGLDEDFAILDQEDQEGILTNIVQELNFKPSDYKARRLLNFINNLKGNLQELTETSEFYENGICLTDQDDVTKIRSILERYQCELKERNALDFDDLIFKTVVLFKQAWDVKVSDTKETHHKVGSYIKEISYVLVDEYHDVNEAQYRFLKLLTAPPKGNLMVVADKDQAIYSWRGSSTEYIEQFRVDFEPYTVGLEKHYRCCGMILDAAKEVISKNVDGDRPLLQTDNPMGEKIVHCTFCKRDDETEEARNIIKLIRNLKTRGSEGSDNEGLPNRIAILYRNHKFADVLAEQLALQDDIRFRRWIQSTNSFQEDYKGAIISYLSLMDSEMSSNLEKDLERAISFPKMCIDELTLAQLKRLARQRKIGLAELLKDIEAYPREVGPLTLENIRQFWERINKFAADVKIGSEKASSIVRKLLDMLESARSPYRREELKIIENCPEVPNLAQARDILHSAVESGDRIHVTASYGIDEYCAAHILRQTLETYLNQTVQVQFLLPNIGRPRVAEKGVHLFIGDFGELEKENMDAHILLIGTIGNKDVKVIQLEQAPGSEESSDIGTVRSIASLKLCQRLIGSFEIRKMEDTVVYDLETTGVNPETANIVQIAACRLDASGNVVGKSMNELVKPPGGHIPKESTEIHGISEEAVKDAPSIKTVLPKFCDFISDSILVGHNIARFDNRILKGDMEAYLEEQPEDKLTILHYDTLVAARRLLPHERRSLEALAGKFNIGYEGGHRADRDVEVSREVFKKLIAIDSQKREVRSLTEFLPLVGLGILTKAEASRSEIAPKDAPKTEVEVFLNAATRSVQIHSSRNHTVDFRQQVGSLLLERKEKSQIGTFIGKLHQAKMGNFPEDIEWKKERADMIKSVRRFEKISGDPRLQSFIDYQTRMINAVRRFEKISNEGDYAPEKGKIDEGQEQLTLMSLHTAKGTEFDVVIIVGMEDFPQNSETIEEERRLFYVGMTRAKKRLYLSTSMYRFYQNQGDELLDSFDTVYSSDDHKDRAASIFVREIPSNYVIKWPQPRHG